jgi:hypothetical protein
MVSHTKKISANVKLQAFNRIAFDFRSKCRDMLLLCKQIWYVPFIWSLSWYLFWIVRSSVVFNETIVPVNPLNYFGAIISIAALFLAVPRFNTKLRKASVLVGTQIGARIKSGFSDFGGQIKNSRAGISSNNKHTQKIQVEKPLQRKFQVKYQVPIKINQAAKLGRSKQLKQPSSKFRALSDSGEYPNQYQRSQEIPVECLTCANLISCDYRQNKFVDPEIRFQKHDACRFAAKLFIDKAVVDS